MNKRLIGSLALSATVVAGLSACTYLEVRSDVNPALVDSVQCHTFAWVGSFRGNSPARANVASPLNEERLRAAISANLAASGVRQAPSGADCLVGYGIGAYSVVSGGYYPYGWGYGYGWGYYGWGWGYPYGWYGGPYVYHQGVVAVDLYDARSRQPLWHATADPSVSSLTGADADKSIRTAIDAIFLHRPKFLGGAPSPPQPAAAPS
jgi:hypothetical protein